MQNGLDDKFIVIKLSNNEDLFDSLKIVIESNEIRSGIILSGIGMLKEFELGYFDPDGYKTRFFSEPHELVSMSGSIAYAKTDTSNLIPHIHCAIADREHQVWGGHLNKAKVNVVNEITILKLSELKLTRLKNDTTGLMELNIED
jgi:predicted DNA-binding protein with PD1-like motif